MIRLPDPRDATSQELMKFREEMRKSGVQHTFELVTPACPPSDPLRQSTLIYAGQRRYIGNGCLRVPSAQEGHVWMAYLTAALQREPPQLDRVFLLAIEGQLLNILALAARQTECPERHRLLHWVEAAYSVTDAVLVGELTCVGTGAALRGDDVVELRQQLLTGTRAAVESATHRLLQIVCAKLPSGTN